MRRGALLLSAVLALLIPGGPAPGRRTRTAPEATICPVPVDAAVTDGFRPPPENWLPGNRGLTFGTEPGQIVRAVRPGPVTFAGPVAGRVYVTVRLDDASDVTYSFLASTPLHTGDEITTGQTVGTTGAEPFQLGYRAGTDYLDPGPLLPGACGWTHAVLVPVPE